MSKAQHETDQDLESSPSAGIEIMGLQLMHWILNAIVIRVIKV